MMRIVNIGQLEGMVSQLFVEAVCPECGRMLTSLVPDAVDILILGCTLCTDIEPSAASFVDGLIAGIIHKNDIIIEEIE